MHGALVALSSQHQPHFREPLPVAGARPAPPTPALPAPCGPRWLQVGTMGLALAQPMGPAVGARSKQANQHSPPGFGKDN